MDFSEFGMLKHHQAIIIYLVLKRRLSNDVDPKVGQNLKLNIGALKANKQNKLQYCC